MTTPDATRVLYVVACGAGAASEISDYRRIEDGQGRSLPHADAIIVAPASPSFARRA